METRAAFLILLFVAPALVTAYPYLWERELQKEGPLTETTCIKHPSEKEGGHGAPVPDATIVLTVAEAGKKKAAVKSLCPGVDYTVTLKYPEKRRTLLTTTEGMWGNANITCPGAVFTPKENKASDNFVSTLMVPCDTKAKSAVLDVTSASSPKGAFQTTKLTLPVLPVDKCPQSTCGGNDTAANATITDEPLAANATITDDPLAANATITDDPLAANATAAAANTTAGATAAAAAENVTAGGKDAAAAKSAEAPKSGETPKKSASAINSPAAFIAALVCMLVVAVAL